MRVLKQEWAAAEAQAMEAAVEYGVKSRPVDELLIPSSNPVQQTADNVLKHYKSSQGKSYLKTGHLDIEQEWNTRPLPLKGTQAQTAYSSW